MSSPLSRRQVRLLDGCELVYRRMLVCLPADLRRQHGDDIASLFRDKVRAALRAGGAGAVLVLARGLFDLLREATREHLAAGPLTSGAAAAHLPEGRAPRRRKERLMESLRQDVCFAARMLRKQPGTSALIVLTLALGIGANTTVFSFVKALFLNPLPVADVATLVSVHGTVEEGSAPGTTHFPISWPNYRDLREQATVLSGLAAFGFAQAGLSDDAAEPEFEAALLVSANYFDVLGIEPALGRFFEPDEEEPPGAHPVLVISHALWQERYGGDPGVIGKVVRVNGHPLTIVGVAPEGFGGTNVLVDFDVWAPMSMHPQMHPYTQFVEARRWRMFQLVGRLDEDSRLDQAAADLRTIAQRLAAAYPDDNRGRLTQVLPLADAAIDPNQRGVFLRSSVFLLGVTGVVLVIACANIANLMLARARGRNREIAVRRSLGAGRWRIIRPIACEGLMLAALGGLASVAVAVFGRDLLWAYRPPAFAASMQIGLDLKVLALTAVLATATGLAFALAPALRAAHVDPSAALRPGAATDAERRSGPISLRSALVVAQVALSFLAVIGAGLFVSSLRQAQSIDPGFPAERLLLVPVNPSAQGYTVERTVQFYAELAADLEAMAEVEAAGFASNPPLTQTFLSRTTIREGDAEDQATLIGTNTVSPGFFEAMAIPLLSGRLFDATDREAARPVIVINHVMAERLWPQEDPLGRRVRFLGEQQFFEVVGVVGSIKYNTLGEAAQPYFYFPVRQQPADGGVFHISTSGAPAAIVDQVRATVHDLDPQLPLDDFEPATAQIENSLWVPRMAASLLSIFGALSLTLAVVGIYGVLVQLVGERRREIGIRMALGANRPQAAGLVARQTLRWVLVGGVVGLGGALAASRFLGSFLYDVSGTDPLTYALTAGILAVTALAAAGLPARRAARVDPAVAMRQE